MIISVIHFLSFFLSFSFGCCVQPDIERFGVFVEEAAAYLDQEQKMQEEMGEIPDEFLGTFFSLCAVCAVCRVRMCVWSCALTLVSGSRVRSDHVRAHGGPGHLALVEQHHGPLGHHAPPPQRSHRPLQPRSPHHRHAAAQYALLLLLLPPLSRLTPSSQSTTLWQQTRSSRRGSKSGSRARGVSEGTKLAE